jgi:hypothetical protein
MVMGFDINRILLSFRAARQSPGFVLGKQPRLTLASQGARFGHAVLPDPKMAQS